MEVGQMLLLGKGGNWTLSHLERLQVRRAKVPEIESTKGNFTN